MHFTTLVGLFFSAFSVAAQSTQTDAATTELLGELAQLPTCAVCTCFTNSSSKPVANGHDRLPAYHHHFPSRSVLLVILTACVPTRRTSQQARNAFSLAAQLKKPCVRLNSTAVPFSLSSMLTLLPVAQRWQQKACKAPFRNTGPVTSRVGTALVIIAGICVVLRFVARWRITGSTVGWDDWTILVSFILLIPSTYMLANSMLSRSD